jgi:hypothetical protein
MTQEIIALPDLSKYHFRTYYNPIGFPMHLSSPVERTDARGVLSTVDSFGELLNLVGVTVDDPEAKFALKQHEERYSRYKLRYFALAAVAYFLFSCPMILIYVLPLALLNIDFNYIALLPLLLIAFISFRISSRVVSILFDRQYADTLSFVACLYLLSNVAKENALIRAQDREQLLSRMRALRMYVGLLPYQYAVAEQPMNTWARGQFGGMAQFVEEKENQIVAPFRNSPTMLFTELRAFLEILLAETYGEFKIENRVGAEAPFPTITSNSIFRGGLKFAGTVTPILLLLSFFFFPERLTFLGIENRVITYISLAWLLLAIDANLKLGIVQGVVSLAKAIKELS